MSILSSSGKSRLILINPDFSEISSENDENVVGFVRLVRLVRLVLHRNTHCALSYNSSYQLTVLQKLYSTLTVALYF